jgi:hypothetical protein
MCFVVHKTASKLKHAILTILSLPVQKTPTGSMFLVEQDKGWLMCVWTKVSLLSALQECRPHPWYPSRSSPISSVGWAPLDQPIRPGSWWPIRGVLKHHSLSSNQPVCPPSGSLGHPPSPPCHSWQLDSSKGRAAQELQES